MLQGKTALVTGGAGFIGSHLVDRLLALDYRVVVIDNLSTGKPENLNPAAVFHHADITHPTVADIVHSEQPDVIFHLAAQISVSNSTKDPLKDSEINVLGTLRLLGAARTCGAGKVIYSCTGGALYGEPETNPCTEDHPIRPMSPYGISKYVGELQLELYRRLYDLNYTSLRYGNVYGPRQDPHGEAGVVAIFSQAMLEGKETHIFGDGDQTKDFIYVDDVVEANICAIGSGGGGAFNIGTGQKTSVNTIFRSLRGFTCYSLEPVFGPVRAGDVYQIYLDASKAARELGWASRVSLEDGLSRTVEYFRRASKAK
jgi:UDP-glucose 4-epimerase